MRWEALAAPLFRCRVPPYRASMLVPLLLAAHPTTVLDYVPGGSTAPFDDPAAALGPPARMSGADLDPGAVTPFQPAWTPDDLVAIAPGGSLTIAFDDPVLDDPANPFGLDLIVFGNSFFIDAAPPAGIVAGIFEDGGTIFVSEDGVTFVEIPDALADGLHPTLGWLDGGPYDDVAGTTPSDFTRPVDPACTTPLLNGLDYAGLLAHYDRSGGGTAVDIGAIGLAAVSYVRIENNGSTIIEIDAFSDVAPEQPGDVDGDGDVDFNDLVALLAVWGSCSAPCAADFNGDGAVDFDDLLTLLGAWTG